MSKREIPESWAIAPLGEFLTIRRGASPRPVGDPKYFGKSGVGWLKISDLTRQGKYILHTNEFVTTAGVEKSVYVPPDNLVLSNSATIGLPAITKIPICVHDGFLTFPNLPKEIDIGFLYNFFLAFRSTLQRKSIKGATQANLNIEIVSNIVCPIPPLLEQKRIVEKIESTQEKVKSVETSISKADELIEKYREALLRKAFRGELVPQDPKDEPASKLIERIRTEKEKQSDGKKNKKNEFKPFNADEIPFQIPSNWCWVRLSQVASDRPYSFVDGPFGSNLNSKHYKDKGIPVLHSGSVAQGYFRTGELKHFVDSKTFKELERSAVYPGDIVIAKIGANYGGSAIVPKGQFEVGLLSGNTMKLTVSDQLALTDFVAIYLWFLKKTQGFENIVKKTAQPALTLGGMKSLLFPLPPLNEQQRIIEQISSSITTLSKLRGYIDALTSSTIKIKESVLQNAFSGKLVAQKPEEGSGKELLKDILVQRSSDKTVNGIERKRQKPK